MAIKKHKPTSPGRRFATWLQHEAVTKTEPEKPHEGLSNSAAERDCPSPPAIAAAAPSASTGRSTSSGARTGCRPRWPQSSTTRTGAPTSRCSITLDGEKRYILAPARISRRRHGLGSDADIAPGNTLPLSAIPTGTIVHNVELVPGKGGQLGRSAGTSIQVVAKEGAYATLRLPSSEMRLVLSDCRATIGALGNAEHELVELGKAGRSRHRGKRPQTRGVAMNPVDHPHGGGEAHHTPGGHPVTPWGVPTLGYRTRKKRKTSDRYIVRGRRRGKKGRR